MKHVEELVRSTTASLYYSDLCISFTIRCILYSSILVVTLIMLVGCGRLDEGGNPSSRDTGISTSDRETRTQNVPPQGGEYEKSDCAPRKPSG
uniref:Uncharacterized protein n=1 Tax=Leviviridae sp. TaxID=2027243 RepID=A0A514DCC4_9VIRU|nr:MAG: hypothetical protein H2RhizoLitter491556_000002 [Leviviridae sp.]